MTQHSLEKSIQEDVNRALGEDLNYQSATQGDITAALIPLEKQVTATVITREPCILCGVKWAEEAFKQIDETIIVKWFKEDKEQCESNDVLCEISGSARNILTAERTALNFLQTLSGTATTTQMYVAKLKGSGITLLDTRKTLPGLRAAQKYAVTCGGGENHRVGLFDAFLIKENHILACGSIANAVEQARKHHPNKKVEVEVESVDELNQAIEARVDVAMLDNFSIEMLNQAVKINNNRVKLEVSGNVTDKNLAKLCHSGIDFISSGALTKDIKSIDLSLRIR